jgi:hypothetical protein
MSCFPYEKSPDKAEEANNCKLYAILSEYYEIPEKQQEKKYDS